MPLGALSRGLLLAAALAGAARADVAPAEVLACVQKQEGDACSGGTCLASTCQRDAPGLSPQTVSYPCLRCTPAASSGGCQVGGGGAGAGWAALGLGLLLGLGGRRQRS